MKVIKSVPPVQPIPPKAAGKSSQRILPRQKSSRPTDPQEHSSQTVAARWISRTVKYLGLTLGLGLVTYAGLDYYRIKVAPGAEQVYPTSIHWLSNEKTCAKTGRDWDGDKCWDKEHSPEF
jgi:hypothetical protein